MSDARRVAWSEGMLLLPQHFQQWERRQEHERRQLAAALQPWPYGFTRLLVDDAALARGVLRLEACAGVMPDGLVFDLPNDGVPPPARQLAERFPPERDRLRVFLALPLEHADGGDLGIDGVADGRSTRYRLASRRLRDSSGDGPEREVVVAEPNLRLLLEGEGLDDHSVLSVAELRRDSGGRLALVDDFAPPCLCVEAAAPLAALLTRVAELLLARCDELAASRRGAGAVEYTWSDVLATLRLQAMRRSLPVLLEARRTPAWHPRSLHLELAGLVGALAAAGDGAPAGELPDYQHQAPLPGLLRLEQRLRELVAGDPSQRSYLALPLRRVNERIQQAALPNGLDDGARFFLSVRSPLAAEQIMKTVPVKVRVGSGKRIQTLIAQALRGIPLSYLAAPPTEIPAQSDCHYFELQAGGSEWQAVGEDASLAIYLPPDLGEARCEFLALRS